MRDLRAPECLILSGLLLLVSACGPAPSVVQGAVVSYDASSKLLAVRDELPPRATMEISIAGAEVGADPTPGDTVRIAFRVVGDRPVATRVMNLTRQEELAKKGGGSAGVH